MLLQQKLPKSQYENDKVEEKEEEDYEEDFETLERDIKKVPVIL
jgi:hypothetical protein